MSATKPPSVPRTRELLAALLAGHSVAEQRLWDLFHPMLVRRAERHRLMRTVRKWASGEDIANEVWVRVYASQSLQSFEYRGRGSLAGFLGKILDNTMHDYTRRIRARCGDSPTEDVSFFAPETSAASPTSTARAGELSELCRQSLSEREWTIFRMKVLEGHGSIEIAAKTGIPPASVRRLHAKTLEKLRQEID